MINFVDLDKKPPERTVFQFCSSLILPGHLVESFDVEQFGLFDADTGILDSAGPRTLRVEMAGIPPCTVYLVVHLKKVITLRLCRGFRVQEKPFCNRWRLGADDYTSNIVSVKSFHVLVL